MMIQAILFDSDGVLVDTERLLYEATSAVFASAGAVISREEWSRWYLGEGKRSREVAELVGIPPSRIDTAIKERDGLFRARIDEGVSVLPGVPETIERLSRRFRLAVVTGASRGHFERVHSSTGLRRYFETIVTCDDYDQVKPHPGAYIKAMERLALDPNECLAVEDSPRGAAAAAAAGIRCVVVPTDLTDLSLCPPGCAIIGDIRRLLTMELGKNEA
jgi:HAD superfamily hydrolase (TIGR01509 family)